MPQVQRTSDIVEMHSEKALSFGLGGLAACVIGIFLFIYRGSSGMFVPLSIILLVIGAGLIGYAVYCLVQVRKVDAVRVTCPYCQGPNLLSTEPDSDFTCSRCFRLVPVLDGKILSVNQVRCGFCNELNYYSEKTEVLLCESCNREVPIARADGMPSTKKIAAGFAVKDDDRPYELILVAHGQHKTEELIGTLQSMLALNRNQVKQLLNEMPVTLLTGIPKKKAEMLRAQIAVHEGLAELRPLP